MNFDGIDFLTTIVGIFFGSLVLSTVGFGIGIAGTPFMLLSMSAPEVVLVINTVSLFVFALLIRETRKSIECRQILFPTVLGVIGVPIGVYLLGIVDPRVLRIAMAFVIIICGSFAGWRKTSIPDSSSLFLPAAFLVGILLTVSGIGGPIMALLAVSKKWTQDTIRGSLSFYFLFVEGTASITLTDELETEVKTIDKRKFIACTVDHQPYHILMEDAIQDYIDLKYMEDETNVDGIDDGSGEAIRELKPTDQIILVQKKDNSSEIHEIWFGNGLDYTIIDREKVDWVFSQDIQTVLMARDQYLTNDSETVFHESESERLIAGYGSQFSVWHSSNFKLSLSSFSMRSNLLQYAANMRVGNELIGLPGLLGGSSELGVATQRSEFGLRMPFAFDVGTVGYNNKNSVLSDEYGGLYARGNIETLFSTTAAFHGLIGINSVT